MHGFLGQVVKKHFFWIKTTTTSQVRGRNLGVDAEHGVRIHEEERGQEVETQGEPQTPIPREKEKRRGNTASTKPAMQKRRRGTHTKTEYGSGLEGLKNHTIYRSQRQKRDTINQMTKPRPQQKNKQRSHPRLQGSVHSRVEGPMGRPAFS